MNFRGVDNSWKKLIRSFEKEAYYIKIRNKIKDWRKEKTVIYPPLKNVWETFKHFKVKDTRVVLLGQDPYINSEYHNKKDIPQAMGLSFSVPKTHKVPPSLRNIFKELKSDLNIDNKSQDLKRWVAK